MFNPFIIKLFLIITLLLSCEHSLTDSSKKSLLSFTDVTKKAGLANFKHVSGSIGNKWFPESMGSGCGFIDYNSDGWVDILLVGGGSWENEADPPSPSLFLYKNNKDGTFKDVTDESGLGEIYTYGFGVCVADYDNDDDHDFFFTTIWNNYLFRNDSGVFVNVSNSSGLGNDSLWSTTSIFFDANKDGFVDLFVGSYVDWSPANDIWCTLDGSTKNYCTPELYNGVASQFYQNNGDGTFSNTTEAAGFLPSPGKMLGAAELDFNNDGWPDLAVASDTQRDLLYQNNGDGTFNEIGAISGVAYDENGRARAGMGIDVGVIDKSGKETIFVGNFSKEMISVFRHSSGQFFEDISAISKVGRPSLMTLTFGLFLLDIDLDGDLDLYTANGHVQIGIEETQDGIFYREPSHLFLNDGNGIFNDIVPLIGGPLSKPIVGRGAAYADYDNNGTLDILVTENNGPAYLIRNNNLNNYLRVKIKSINSNRDGIGTKLIATTKDNRMIRRVKTGSSFMSHSEATITFGLGKHQMVDSLYVYWPNNKIDIFLDIQSSQEILLIENNAN